MAEHIKHVQRPDVFGTHVEILAIATFLDVPIFYCGLSGREQQYSWHYVEQLKQQGLRYRDKKSITMQDMCGRIKGACLMWDLPQHLKQQQIKNIKQRNKKI